MRLLTIFSAIVLAFLSFGSLKAQHSPIYTTPLSSLNENRGFNFQVSTIGLGFGGTWGKRAFDNVWFNLSSRLDLIQEDGDIPRNTVTGETINNESTILMVPVILETRYYPHFDALDPSLRPHFGVGVGGILGWSFPRDDAEDGVKNNFAMAPTGFVNLGVDYFSSNFSYFGFNIRYNFVKFAEPLFGTDDEYSNFALMVNFGKLIK
ncbi:MAG: hypothetical protein DWQ06_09065 [Calditrichaeota bacterium]|nr:MAG: hypothetical protein DWQ06_09065 [Calditrichota bacterium]